MNNNEQISLLAKLLVTRMSHDLAGPLGGIANGIEFISDSINSDDNTEQALSLLGLSSEEGSAKLQVFRQAYGIINQVGEKTDIKLIQELLDQYFKHSKIEIEWNIPDIEGIDHRSRQILINLVLVVASALIMGGKVTITVENGENTSLHVKGEGQQIKYDENTTKIINKEISLDQITPHTIQTFFSVHLVDESQSQLTHGSGENFFELAVSGLPV